MEQVENRISGTKNKVVKDHEKTQRKYEWNMQDVWDTVKKPNL
jgi:ribosomal protein L28